MIRLLGMVTILGAVMFTVAAWMFVFEIVDKLNQLFGV